MFAVFVCLLALAAGCGRGGVTTREYVWVSAPTVKLRDRVAAVYNPTATVRNGDRLLVLDRQKRFVKVRTAAAQEGWIEQRYVVTQEVYDAFQKLVSDARLLQPQARGLARSVVNLHDEPKRDADHLYQIKEGDKIELLKRGTGEKPGTVVRPTPSAVPAAAAKTGGAKTAAPLQSAPAKAAAEAPVLAPALEDWWLVRDANQHVGWVLSRMVDLDVPLDVAQYAEGQRIVAAFVLNIVNDPGYEPSQEGPALSTGAPAAPAAPPAGSAAADPHQRPQYLVLLTEPRDGQPFDYNQARVFTWNVRRHRYETAYRERGFYGMLTVRVAREDFGKEGTLPTFTLLVQDESGQLVERKYKLNTPIVRRIQTGADAKIRRIAPARSSPGKSPRKHSPKR